MSEDSVGKVRLKIGEGLTGLAMKEQVPINVREPQKHPNYRYFAHIDEEKFQSFLSVPIMRGISRVGAISLHREKDELFGGQDVQALQVIASQLATILESTSLFLKLAPETAMVERQKPVTYEDQRVFKGVSASEGFAMGEVFILDRHRSFSLLEEQEFRGQECSGFFRPESLERRRRKSIQGYRSRAHRR